MKTFVSIFLVLFTVVAIGAEPTAADRGLVDKYKDVVFDMARVVREQKPEQDFGDQRFYRLADNTDMWLFPDGYVVVQTPDKVEISIYCDGVKAYGYEGAKEYERRFVLPSGRTCYKEPLKPLEWGLVLEQAPDFTLPVLDADGKRVHLAELRGKVVLLDFWASWCPYCMQGLPKTEALFRKYKARGLEVLGIDIEGDTAKAKAAATSLGLTFPVLMSEPDGQGHFDMSAKQMTDYRVHAVPQMVLIGKDGVIRKMDDVTDKEIEDLLRR